MIKTPFQVEKSAVHYTVSNENQEIKAVFKTNDGQDGYCTEFNELSETNKTLVNDNSTSFVINEGKTLRFTYVAYFEGNDMDCHGSIPAESYLHLSLHFGV